MKLRDTVVLALQSLRGNLLRSALTALGVIIGIAAVIVMVAIGEGTQAALDRAISLLGSNRLEVLAGVGKTGATRLGTGSKWTLTESDTLAIKNDVDGVIYSAASVRIGVQIVAGSANWASTVYGVDADFFAVNNWQLDSGQWFNPSDYTGAAKTALLGATVRKNLFGEENPLGQTIRIERVPIQVVGVLAPKGQGGFGQDLDDVVFVPLETAKRRLPAGKSISGDYVRQISLGIASATQMASTQEAITELLRQRHHVQPGDQDDFEIRNLSEIIATRTETTRLMSILLSSVAIISLVVGGIGIMNIMLVSVTERFREIGLRMAVGASPREIKQQFLSEALAISLGGGVVGMVLGIVGALVAGHMSALPVRLSPQIILLATGFALATGLFFGYYPAHKAAQLDPIEALRTE